MSTSSCTSALTQCELRFPPVGSASDPVTNFFCQPGSFITQIRTGECTTCGDPYVGCIREVRCSDGTVLAGTAGDCVNDTGEVVSDCGGAGQLGGGIIGFGGRAGSSMDVLTVLCANGGQAATPVFNPSGGSAFTSQSCPTNTHRMTGITASSANSQSRVKTLIATCTPLNNICQGEVLNDPVCTTFCNGNVPSCDSALINYCSSDVNFNKPICGCAKPASQYTTLNLISQSSGVALPVACAAECASTSAIAVANKGTCNVGVVCVQSNIDITAAQSQLGGGITLSQNCGNSGGGGSTTSNFFSSPIFYIILAVVILAIIGVIILVIVNNNNKNKRLEEDRREERRRRLAAQQRPQIVRV